MAYQLHKLHGSDQTPPLWPVVSCMNSYNLAKDLSLLLTPLILTILANQIVNFRTNLRISNQTKFVPAHSLVNRSTLFLAHWTI